MSKHYSMKAPKFAVRFEPAEKATVHGGQLAVAAALEQFGLKKRVQTVKALDPRTDRNKGYDPIVYVAGVIYALTSGDCTLAGVEKLNEDETLKMFLGVDRFPDESSVGEWLRNIGEKGAQALRELGREFVAWAFALAEPRRYQHGGQTEAFFDDTQIEVYGPHFEGAKINYNGNLALAWQTLWVGPFLADGVFGAEGDPSSQLRPLLEENGRLWDKATTYLYADSASSAGDFLNAIGEHFGAWSVSYNKWTQPLERQAATLPEALWSHGVERKGRKGERILEQYQSMRYQPEGCEQPVRFAVARYRGLDEMFWRYSFVATQEHEGSAQAVFERHRLKGDWERRFSEVLTDLDLHHPPCKSLNANRAYYALASLAYNVLQALKVIWLPETELASRVRTLIHRLLLIPVQIKRHARRLCACFYAPRKLLSWWRQFLEVELARCRVLDRGLSPPCPA